MQFFGQFLIQERAITVPQLRDALALMDTENLKLGQLAVEQALLTESQANEINREQRYTDRPFGAIAVEQGLLTDEQLRDLLNKQNQRRIRIGEALVRLDHLTPEALVSLLRLFKEQEELFAVEEHDLPGFLNGHRMAEFVLELIPRIAMRVSSVQVKVPKKCANYERNVTHPVMASILIRSENSLRVAITSNESFAEELADGVFGHAEDLTKHEVLSEGLGEYLNIVLGCAITAIEQEGILAEIDPPILGIPPIDGFEFKLCASWGEASLVLAEA